MAIITFDYEKPAQRKAELLNQEAKGKCLWAVVMRPDSKYVIVKLVNGEYAGQYSVFVAAGKSASGVDIMSPAPDVLPMNQLWNDIPKAEVRP